MFAALSLLLTLILMGQFAAVHLQNEKLKAARASETDAKMMAQAALSAELRAYARASDDAKSLKEIRKKLQNVRDWKAEAQRQAVLNQTMILMLRRDLDRRSGGEVAHAISRLGYESPLAYAKKPTFRITRSSHFHRTLRLNTDLALDRNAIVSAIPINTNNMKLESIGAEVTFTDEAVYQYTAFDVFANEIAKRLTLDFETRIYAQLMLEFARKDERV